MSELAIGDEGSEPVGSALDAWVDEVHARISAKDRRAAQLRAADPELADAIEQSDEVVEAERRRRWDARVTELERARYEGDAPRRSNVPLSYAELNAQIDRNQRDLLTCWEQAQQRQHQRDAQRLAEAERLVVVEHQLAMQRMQTWHQTQSPRPAGPSPIVGAIVARLVALLIVALAAVVAFVFLIFAAIVAGGDTPTPQERLDRARQVDTGVWSQP